ncbi:MAG: metallophosphoesterase [archaeon]
MPGFHTIFAAMLLLTWLLSSTVAAIVLSLLGKKRPLIFGAAYGGLYFLALMAMQLLNRSLELKVVEEAFYLLGILCYAAFAVAVPAYLLPKVSRRTKLAIIIAITSLVMLRGVYNAQTLTVRNLELTSDKLAGEHDIVLVGDVHVGSESRDYLARVVEKINSLGPEMVLINGDLTDDRSIQLKELAEIGELQAPAYYVSGNHDRQHTEDTEFVDVLNNEIKNLGEIDLIGVMNNGGYDSINTSRYSIVLIHQPVGMEDYAAKGADLMLAAHTHGGQIWPYNYVHKAAYGYVYGLHEIGGMNLFVTSGAGVWGPNFRLGTRNEIVHIRLRPE